MKCPKCKKSMLLESRIYGKMLFGYKYNSINLLRYYHYFICKIKYHIKNKIFKF